ncbi:MULTISPECIES: enoyl-CoA hydratase/isomerase family protein [unclassified Bosea (in: a-proteobacteria)]|uniref:enoyl-CoA hydratase/isomerase family protein n=1 Tax=unclassified Bosea (in: a-proteobacteria) TaxID=2653178 RepID=UPI000F75E2A6|nr:MULTISPECIES: enoyl-CoA hydratase/isomerase family protein [unclassified Bosea (in: a-proteobacteria)]AZO79947.1 enoyl-CoA hydratase [Bosea sp. Tri-49]RXT22724.1 enoyl-CoA hydratase [Bosea sp. Tri-39]RXT38192.1 enoyl-CoA hydratase [Bosea sp. Tri-54]
MKDSVLVEVRGAVGILTLNRPQILNAWNAPMRSRLVEGLDELEANEAVRAIILTGAGERAFGAGQDLNETKTFDPDRAELWMGEWERLYDRLRSLSKPIIAALNGVAAGSAFQVALLCDLRIGHDGVTMGQPEINSGIASVTGPWIMREMIGIARTIDLTLTGRMMDADECFRIGLINRIVPKQKVMEATLALAEELAGKPPVAMRLNKARFREVTEESFRECLRAGIRNQREAYGTGEPARMMEQFLAVRAARKSA